MTTWTGGTLRKIVQSQLDNRPGVRLGRAVAALLGTAAVGLGRLIGVARLAVPFVPGTAGAAGLSLAVGEIAGHVFGHGLSPWVALLAGALFCLRIDGRVTLRRGRGDG